MTENTVSRRIFIMGTAAAAAATMGSGTASAQEGQKTYTVPETIGVQISQ